MSSAIKFPCKICKNNVTNSDQAIQCDLCDSWVHIKCNDLNFIDYKFLQNSNDPWFCISCCSEIFPFSTVKNKNFISNFYDSNKANNTVDKDSSLLLKPSEHLKQLVNEFNICHRKLMILTLLTLKILFHLNTMILMKFRL